MKFFLYSFLVQVFVGCFKNIFLVQIELQLMNSFKGKLFIRVDFPDCYPTILINPKCAQKTKESWSLVCMGLVPSLHSLTR
jgi:hypothetical protein